MKARCKFGICVWIGLFLVGYRCSPAACPKKCEETDKWAYIVNNDGTGNPYRYGEKYSGLTCVDGAKTMLGDNSNCTQGSVQLEWKTCTDADSDCADRDVYVPASFMICPNQWEGMITGWVCESGE